MDINDFKPGFYMLECTEEFGYDECFFWWTKGKKYRMEIDKFGGCNVTSDTYIFTPMGNRFQEMMECFIAEKDLVNMRGLVEDFLDKRKLSYQEQQRT